ncbi:hypothetical protein [Akkermansia muciniphila]|jgi:hypothetical protein|uniref:hypothetical protein n=1 Tax=Akkermansia muciniphila TaxID=239935 RepID=UPI0020A45949|nr:hypothetical protein [Akkermansia muciniphila]MCP2374713.1 hypothetical protein [Akkermansia muciniphila]
MKEFFRWAIFLLITVPFWLGLTWIAFAWAVNLWKQKSCIKKGLSLIVFAISVFVFLLLIIQFCDKLGVFPELDE